MYAAAVLFLVALLDGDGVQVRHEGVQQAGLGVDGQQGLRAAVPFLSHTITVTPLASSASGGRLPSRCRWYWS